MDNSLFSVISRLIPNKTLLIFFILFCSLALLPPAMAATSQSKAIHFDLEVLPAAKRYAELAAYPSYLAVALYNNGFTPSQAGRVIVEDARTLRFRNSVLTFVRQEKGVYHYRTTVEFAVGNSRPTFELLVEADLSRVGDGKVAIRVFPPLAQLFPEELIDRIRAKVQSFANPAVQQRMLDYFEGLPGSKEVSLDTARMFERILIDAYNLPAVAPGLLGAREPGDAESIGDQWMLLATLAFWLVIVPGFFAARMAWNRRTSGNG